MQQPIKLPDDFVTTYPVIITLPVQWGDQDAFGHVNNTIYFRWFESARIAYADRVGLSDLMTRTNVGPILASIQCHYRRQVTYPESVHIGARVTRIGRTSFSVVHAILRASDLVLAAEGESTVVVFDYNAQAPCPVPEEIRAAIESLEKTSFR